MSGNDIRFGRGGQSAVHKVRLVSGIVRFSCGHERPTGFADVLKVGDRVPGIPWKAWCVTCDKARPITEVTR